MNQLILPAATVVLLREKASQLQVLLLRRNPELGFAGDIWVFPGGKVDDMELERANGDLSVANREAAVRECREETRLTIDGADLLPISHWTTPDFHTKRFATQFYICRVSAKSSVTVDQGEIVEFAWLTATEALERHKQGSLKLFPPTVVTLTEMAEKQNYAELRQFYQAATGMSYHPRMIKQGDGRAIFLYQGDSGYLTENPDLNEDLNRCVLQDGVFEYLTNLT